MYEKSLALYQNLVHNEVIPAIEKEDNQLLSPKEVQSIINELEIVVENQNKEIQQEIKYYQLESCENCELCSLCTKTKGNCPRQIQKNMNLEYFKAQIREKTFRKPHIRIL